LTTDNKDNGFISDIAGKSVKLGTVLAVFGSAFPIALGVGAFTESMMNLSKKTNAVISSDKSQGKEIAALREQNKYLQRQLSELKHWLRPVKVIDSELDNE